MNKNIKYIEYTIDLVAILIVIESFLRFLGLININRLMSRNIDMVFIGVLIIDLSHRYYRSSNKQHFIKENWIEFIALIPFLPGFRLFRIVRIIRKSRLKNFFMFVHKVLKAHSLYYVILVVFLLALVGGGLLFKVEGPSGLETVGDGVWFAFVTMTTVGYGDFTPATSGGRVIAILLMLIGIGFLSVLTGTVASVFTNSAKRIKARGNSQHVDISDLDVFQREQVMDYVTYIRDKK